MKLNILFRDDGGHARTRGGKSGTCQLRQRGRLGSLRAPSGTSGEVDTRCNPLRVDQDQYIPLQYNQGGAQNQISRMNWALIEHYWGVGGHPTLAPSLLCRWGFVHPRQLAFFLRRAVQAKLTQNFSILQDLTGCLSNSHFEYIVNIKVIKLKLNSQVSV